MISLLILIAGFVLLIFGANKLVEGASSLASKLGIPDIVIGLTVVAFGTSAPELVVNLMAALNGNSELVLGNILGSNIFNVLGILGITSMILPLKVKTDTTWLEIPMSLLAAVSLFFLISDVNYDGADFNFLSRTDGIILLLFFSIFLVYNIKVSQNGTEEKVSGRIELSTLKSILYLLTGFAGLVVGGNLIVRGAVDIALMIGLSERVIGLTIVSIGTSLPELATSIAAVRKKNVDIAIGNVVGSNIFNIFFVLGVSVVASPFRINPDSLFDVYVNILAGILLFAFIFIGRGRQLVKWEGFLFLSIYIVYLIIIVS
ncbi:MAG TPA: calcium/sodium antiporter [Ignavibacteria bacterium]|nr:calcium/sodium antiporter [Ignavibacteria bacterium]HMR39767.1 calcium/sodium antiporter [Ignavibacteria bacterium]